MKRSAMAPAKAWNLTNGATLKRTTLKRRPPKSTAIRASARDELCTLNFPCCNWDPATTVWCHSNHSEDGKGMGVKARDSEGCYGCSSCHAFLDGGYTAAHWERFVVDAWFNRARAASRVILHRKGLLDGR